MKILICDDDISTVDVIQHQLNWTALGVSQVLRAYNGEAAIRLIDSQRPEIILCDIGMPKVSGIEVLRHIYDNKIPAAFSFLTCHEEFEYARAAIRYGASGYVTKPFDMAELNSEVQHLVQQARSRTSAPGREAQARQDSVLNNVLRQISDGMVGTDLSAVASLLSRNALELSAQSSWQLVMTCADITDALQGPWSRELLSYTLTRLHDETLADYIGSAYCLTDFDSRFLVCTCFVPGRMEQALPQRCHMLMELCVNQVGLRPSILISAPFPLFRAAAVKGEMAARLPRIRVLAGKILTLEEADRAAGPGSFLDAHLLLGYLKRRDRQGCLEYIGMAIHRIITSGDYTREVMDDFRRELLHVFLSCLRDNGISPQEAFEDAQLSALSREPALTRQVLLRYADRLFFLTDQALQSLAEGEDIMAKADEYIRAHFRENINREDVAAVACITPNYLSKQFHSRKGMNLREYINKIRIDEAKRLLLTTSLSVSEVAGNVGYDNISYFSTVFRKHTGMSPVDWRTASQGGTHEDKKTI